MIWKNSSTKSPQQLLKTSTKRPLKSGCGQIDVVKGRHSRKLGHSAPNPTKFIQRGCPHGLRAPVC